MLKPARLGGLHMLEHVRGDRGHKREGHKQRRGKHISDGERKGHEQLTHKARGENRRQEHAYRGERGGHDGTRDLLGTLYRSARRRNAAAAQAIDVLQHDDGVVHEHTDGQRDAAKSEDVDREAGEIHKDERAQHRERDGERHDERGLHRLEEQGENHNGQGRAQNQRLQDVADEQLDVGALVVQGVNLKVGVVLLELNDTSGAGLRYVGG